MNHPGAIFYCIINHKNNLYAPLLNVNMLHLKQKLKISNWIKITLHKLDLFYLSQLKNV